MNIQVKTEVYDPHSKAPAKTWSVMRCKRISGAGAVWPTQLTFDRAISGVGLMAYIVANIKDDPFKGYKHFLVSPIEPAKPKPKICSSCGKSVIAAGIADPGPVCQGCAYDITFGGAK